MSNSELTIKRNVQGQVLWTDPETDKVLTAMAEEALGVLEAGDSARASELVGLIVAVIDLGAACGRIRFEDGATKLKVPGELADKTKTAMLALLRSGKHGAEMLRDAAGGGVVLLESEMEIASALVACGHAEWEVGTVEPTLIATAKGRAMLEEAGVDIDTDGNDDSTPDEDDEGDDPTNVGRVEKVRRVLEEHYDDDLDGAPVDLLTDLRHYVEVAHEYGWADKALTWEAVNRTSLTHYEVEREYWGWGKGEYGWVITRDLLAEKDENPAPEGTLNNLVGVRSFGATAEKLKGREHVLFRLIDDDGEVYFEGLAAGVDCATRFDPLDDFGRPNAGCVSMQVRMPGRDTQWETL